MTGSAETPSHLVVAVVRRAIGVRGEVEVIVTSDDPHRFEPGSRMRTLEGAELTVVRTRTHRGRTIVAFEELTDRNEAEALRGHELVVPRGETRELGSDEYWDFELVGCRVRTLDGAEIGHVAEVLHPPANEVLVVRDDDAEHLIPFVRSVIRSVDREDRVIEIDPIPGLLDE